MTRSGALVGGGENDSYAMWLTPGPGTNTGNLTGQVCDVRGCIPELSAPTPLTSGTWYHVAYTVDSNGHQHALYVNGGLAASAANTRTVSYGYDFRPLFLGRNTRFGSPMGFLDGCIDEASIYNRALTAAEIRSIYNAGPAGKEPVTVPVVADVSPIGGPVDGGDTVTVTGIRFTGATSVSFGSVPGTNLVVANDAQLTVTSSAATASGTVDVTVTTAAGTSATTPADQFSYVTAPALTRVSPERERGAMSMPAWWDPKDRTIITDSQSLVPGMLCVGAESITFLTPDARVFDCPLRQTALSSKNPWRRLSVRITSGGTVYRIYLSPPTSSTPKLSRNQLRGIAEAANDRSGDYLGLADAVLGAMSHLPGAFGVIGFVADLFVQLDEGLSQEEALRYYRENYKLVKERFRGAGRIQAS